MEVWNCLNLIWSCSIVVSLSSYQFSVIISQIAYSWDKIYTWDTLHGTSIFNQEPLPIVISKKGEKHTWDGVHPTYTLAKCHEYKKELLSYIKEYYFSHKGKTYAWWSCNCEVRGRWGREGGQCPWNLDPTMQRGRLYDSNPLPPYRMLKLYCFCPTLSQR